MIIKSMSRKAPTFRQLIDYIGRDADPHIGTTFARNLYHSGQDEQVVAGQFLDNYRYLPKRKNGNALYHEVIVLEPQAHLSKAEVATALHKLAEQYCEARAPHQLAWGRVHWDTEYPHMHLMISSNAVRSPLRVRMDKSGFARVQQNLEAFKEAQFPELNGGAIYRQAKEKIRPRITSSEGEMVRRTGTPSGKIAVFELLRPVFGQAASPKALKGDLNQLGFGLYQRGKTIGVRNLDTDRRYRLRTLGLETAYEQIVERNPVPSQAPKTSISKSTEPKTDPHAASLLRRREALEERAQDQLDGFERDNEDGNER
ncbi:MAG: relaxase/mobilization nuclease domain-containing protein [Rhodobacteraceae bacterium]|nr:relaxase/mobilization nuclease domain-containing protein [Paracoccaceae bacterium]